MEKVTQQIAKTTLNVLLRSQRWRDTYHVLEKLEKYKKGAHVLEATALITELKLRTTNPWYKDIQQVFTFNHNTKCWEIKPNGERILQHKHGTLRWKLLKTLKNLSQQPSQYVALL
jgi:hypothetical protein